MTHLKPSKIQLNLSTKATLGTKESGHCGEVAIIWGGSCVT